MAIGVFGLKKVYKRQLENLDNNNFLSWPESATTGYFGGGNAPPTVSPVSVSTIDRLDFSTETVSVPTPKLSQARNDLSATSSSSYGYFGGGSIPTPGVVSTIDRLDFSTETVTIPSQKLTQARNGLAAVSNAN